MTPQQLADIHAAAFTMPRPWSASEITAQLEGVGCFLVCCDQGFAIGRAVAGEAELLTIAVHPRARRQGKARHLLSAFETQACERDAQTAFLEVAASNIPAITLYERAGFVGRGRRANYYRAPDGTLVDALILSKALAPAQGALK